MQRVNVNAVEFRYDTDDPDGFRAGMSRLGPDLGAKQTGTTIYELPPGQAVCPYHYEYAEEEWVLVLEGKPSVRDPDGTHQLEPGDLVFFPTGPAGAHQVRNDSDSPARVAMYSPVITPAASVYPDSDKIGVWTGNDDDNAMFRRTTKVEYFTDEPGV